jgi:hypothetical protein
MTAFDAAFVQRRTTYEFLALHRRIAPMRSEVAAIIDHDVVDPGFHRRENIELDRSARGGGPGPAPDHGNLNEIDVNFI